MTAPLVGSSATYLGVEESHESVAADINPIGAISKTDLKKFIAYAETAFNLPILKK